MCTSCGSPEPKPVPNTPVPPPVNTSDKTPVLSTASCPQKLCVIPIVPFVFATCTL